MKRTLRSILAAGIGALAATAWGASDANAEGVKLRPGPGLAVDSKGGPLRLPGGVACGLKLLVAADTGNGRLVLYDAGDGGYVPRSEFSVSELPAPIRVQFDSKGSLLVLDGISRRIGRVGLDGAFLGFVAVDAGAGPTPVIRSFATGADGGVYALDIAGGRVLVVAPDGNLVRQVTLPAEARAPADVAVDPSGRIYVIDSSGPRLYAAAKDQAAAAAITGDLREDMDFATALAVDGDGRIFVLDAHGGGIVIFGSDGGFRGRQAGFGWTDGLLRWPSSICAGVHGTVAVADRENNRVATFTVAQ